MASGALTFHVEQWRGEVLTLSAQLEAALDFSDEDDVGVDVESGTLPAGFATRCAALVDDLERWLARPRA
ncbi:hypothetical protein ABTK61_19575, partial [Acinetobacter baumannii]